MLDRLPGGRLRAPQHVEVELVLPRPSAQGPRLDLRKVDAAVRKGPQSAMKRPRRVLEDEDDRGLRRLLDGAGLLGEDEETRVVLRIVLDALEEDLAAIDRRGQGGGDGGVGVG